MLRGLRIVGVDRVDDQPAVFRRQRASMLAGAPDQQREPFGQEGAIRGAVGELKRVEPGRLARP